MTRWLTVVDCQSGLATEGQGRAGSTPLEAMLRNIPKGSNRAALPTLGLVYFISVQSA
ncbi:hypothetical protein Psta_1860 [Pirellula staleyi DSM 6068]|uniref:Uncharacterized protein n=1 Tax=Pirellula staleyi (strain ATCC 27377 / DSM 6068 / ICPB 4128) TaxID=530564 RepID=D2QZQ1_PIRSD|nr:hypothetical protein Psta_1860 [Pirellula staleyi DSM 6068]